MMDVRTEVRVVVAVPLDVLFHPRDGTAGQGRCGVPGALIPLDLAVMRGMAECERCQARRPQ